MTIDYSKLLRDYAESLPDAFEDAGWTMGTLPKRHGVDKELWEYVERNKPETYEELTIRYCLLAYPLDVPIDYA